MMRRMAVLGISLAIAATACGVRSDRVTAPVEVPLTLATTPPDGEPAADACVVTSGDGLGARVTDTIPGTAGAAALSTGDVIVEFAGMTIASSGALVQAVRARAVGDTVDVVLQSGETRSLTLQESPEAAGVPRLGVLVTTLDDTVDAESLSAGDIDGAGVRVVDMNDRLWLFDPATTTWRRLGIGSPPAPWVALDGEVHTLSFDLDNGGALITSLVSRRTANVAIGDLLLEGLYTSLEDFLLIGTALPSAANPESNAHMVTAVEAATGTIRWTWNVPDDGDTRVVPSFGFRSPTGSMTLLALTPENDLSSLRYVILREIDGAPDAVLTEFPDDFVAIGWHDATSVAGVVPPSIMSLTIVDVTDGTTRNELIGLSAVPIGLWPVGDGEHLIIEDGANLHVLEVGGADRRLLTRSCGPALLSESGWSA